MSWQNTKWARSSCCCFWTPHNKRTHLIFPYYTLSYVYHFQYIKRLPIFLPVSLTTTHDRYRPHTLRFTSSLSSSTTYPLENKAWIPQRCFSFSFGYVYYVVDVVIFCCSATVKGRYGRHTSGMAGKKLLKVKNVSLQILASSKFWQSINNAILELYQN